jgi:hypothetical protein
MKLLIILLGYCHGFTPVKNLIATKAFTDSLLNNINQEIITDGSIAKDIFQYHLHPELDLFYSGVFVFSAYLQYNMFYNRKNWNDIELYKKSRRRFNSILMILFVLFVRNIDNAI